MKNKFSMLLVLFLLVKCISYGQDSVRTKNDKPGTPSSLRTPDNSPQNQVHIINTNKAAGQTIDHGSTESNKVNNTKGQTIISNNDNNNGAIIEQTPASTINNSLNQKDSSIDNNSLDKKPANVTNPTRK